MANRNKLQIIHVEDNYAVQRRLAVRPVSQHTTKSSAGPVLTPTLPAWVVQARDFKNWDVALKLLIKDLISEFDAVQADRIRAYCAPLRVSDQVLPGFFWLDAQGCITVNETWAKDRALDSDGDQAFIVWTKDRNAAYFIKYPLTMQVPKLYLQQTKAPDTWKDYDPKLEIWDTPKCTNVVLKTEAPAEDPFDWKIVNKSQLLTEQEIRDGFLKVHRNGEIGLKTNKWDAFELYQAYQARMSYIDTCRHLLKNPGRFYELEGDLKANRSGLGAKTHVQQSHGYDVEEVRHVITDEGRWRLQGKPGTVDQSVLRSLITADMEQQSKLEETLKGLSFTQPNSRTGSSKTEEEVELTYPQMEKDRRNAEGEIIRRGRNFTERLESLGAIVWEDLPHKDPSLPPAQILRVYHRKTSKHAGTPVALHDTRRGHSSMHYQWYLPPVAVLKEGRVLWLKARDMLESEIAGIKTDIDGVKWPQSWGAIEGWPAKANQLQQALQRFVGKYGIPSIVSNEFDTMGTFVVKRAFTVVYGTTIPEDMWDLVQPLRQWFKEHSTYAPGILGGVKGSTHPWRRYLIADPQTLVPLITESLDSPVMDSVRRCSAKRVGEIHSQLAQAIPLGKTAIQNPGVPAQHWKGRKARLFIFGDGTRGQLYAFPSGQKLQDIPGVFLAQVNDRPDEDRGISVPMAYKTLAGDDRICYVSEARATIGTGKIITAHGMKNYCGVETEQIYALIPGNGSVAVDFAISQFELMSGEVTDDEGRVWSGKKCLETFLETGNAKNVTVQWNGETIRGKLVEVSMFRTTTASENTRPETRVRTVTGVAKHAVRAALMASVDEYGSPDTNDWLNWDDRAIGIAGEPRLKPRDLRYVRMLQMAGQVIGSNIGICDSPRPSLEVEEFFREIDMEESKS